MPKGAYTRKDAQRCSKAAERVRIHRAGNPTPDVPVNGVDRACNAFFESRGFKPSISEQLQTQGVVIGAKVWKSRKEGSKEWVRRTTDGEVSRDLGKMYGARLNLGL